MTRWQFIGAPQFTGLQNIIGVLHDALFWTSMWNICRFLMWYVPIVFITALLLLPDYAGLTMAGVYRLKLFTGKYLVRGGVLNCLFPSL